MDMCFLRIRTAFVAAPTLILSATFHMRNALESKDLSLETNVSSVPAASTGVEKSSVRVTFSLDLTASVSCVLVNGRAVSAYMASECENSKGTLTVVGNLDIS